MNKRRQILENLGRLPYRVRTVPSLVEVVRSGSDVVRSLREISVEDLLGRDGVPPQVHLLEKCIKGKGVLITGGGGSIGSELSRQVLSLGPAELVILDHSEYALYQIEQELRRSAAMTNSPARMRFVLGSVTDPVTLRSLFAGGAISTVYHAAAYKHVPIVEECPLEGLRNNVLGTWQLARHAAESAVSHFILVSTDKAVRPTNVMGASKRMAELVIQSLSSRAGAAVFSIVRFGNVLGSSGSVVPLFKSQIERGGPLTLTHPDVTRYFMTIHEAVQLVIQAGAMAQGGEVFVLDMGEPRRIADLAQTMIRLSGRTVRSDENPDGDIGIKIVGLRPGEKLFEELLIGGEATGTAHPRIWQVIEPGVDAQELDAELSALNDSYRHGQVGMINVEALLKKWVSGYHKPRLEAGGPTVEASASSSATSYFVEQPGMVG